MFKIDTTSSTYDFVANIVSTVVGIGAGSIVGAFCDSVINFDDRSIGEQNKMAIGKCGIKVVTTCTISNEFRKNLDDFANGWNEIVDILDGVKGEGEADPEVVYEDVEVVNG